MGERSIYGNFSDVLRVINYEKTMQCTLRLSVNCYNYTVPEYYMKLDDWISSATSKLVGKRSFIMCTGWAYKEPL